MKKTLIGITISLIVILFLKESGILDAFLFFILIGAVPGTTLSLSPSATIAIITTIITLILRHVFAPTIETYRTTRLLRHTQTARTPKRRFSEI